MQARLRADSLLKSTTACGGLTFTRGEWLEIPVHEEHSARANPELEVNTEQPEHSVLVITKPKGRGRKQR